MKKSIGIILMVVGIAALTGLGIFYWKTLRGIGPVDKLAVCFSSPLELRYACNVDEDCICSGDGPFTGNKAYYNNCVDKSTVSSDFCGGVGGEKPVACVNKLCTLSYPKVDWSFEQCDALSTDATRAVCKWELVSLKAGAYTDESFCNSIKPEVGFSQTQCKDLFFRIKAYSTGNATWCENIIDSNERGACNP